MIHYINNKSYVIRILDIDKYEVSRKIFGRGKWQPTPVFLPGESGGQGSLVGCWLWGCRVGHDWSELAAAAAERYLGKERKQTPQE